jgi:hypothetical protein
MKTTGSITFFILAFVLLGCERNMPVAPSLAYFDTSVPWERISGPEGGRIISLAISGTNTFAGTQAGVFRSTNNGTNWVAANSGLPLNATVADFALRGDSLLAATNGGVFLSTDNGGNWSRVGSLQ